MLPPDPRLPAFARAIGLDAAPSRGAMASIVDWSALERPPGIDPEWTAHRRSLTIDEPDGAVGQWSFSHEGRSFIGIDLYLSSVDYSAAHRHLMARAAATSTPVVPYQPLPLGVGELCAGMLTAEQSLVLWASRNLCGQLSVEGPGVDVAALVTALDGMATAIPFAELATRRPSLDAVRIDPPRIVVDERATLEVEVAKRGPGTDPRVTYRPGGPEVFIEEPTPTHARIGGARAGSASVLVGVVDHLTMLASTTTVALEVAERPG